MWRAFRRQGLTDVTGEEEGRRPLGGRYRVDGSLGRGGMSEVFHGYDERLDRRVAIKVLRPPSAPALAGPDSPEALEILDALDRDRKRFLREIRTAARLELPGVPAVYDTVHRDIKAANVMVIDGGLVKVLDFGIAVLRGAGALPRLTQIDRTIGTPPYMSPEQCLGHAVTSASDVYSLGCLLCELLTGDPPFQGTADQSLRSPSPVAGTVEVRTAGRHPHCGAPPIMAVALRSPTPSSSSCRRTLRCWFAVAQLFAAAGRRDDALAELQAVRPLLTDAFGAGRCAVPGPEW
jgi:serine/threonine protein kinase